MKVGPGCIASRPDLWEDFPPKGRTAPKQPSDTCPPHTPSRRPTRESSANHRLGERVLGRANVDWRCSAGANKRPDMPTYLHSVCRAVQCTWTRLVRETAQFAPRMRCGAVPGRNAFSRWARGDRHEKAMRAPSPPLLAGWEQQQFPSHQSVERQEI